MTQLDKLRAEARKLADASFPLHRLMSQLAQDHVRLTKLRVGCSLRDVHDNDDYSLALARYVYLRRRYRSSERVRIARQHCHDLVREAQQ